MVSFDKLQIVGKALMLPVAVLPVAAIFLRLGADDVFNIDVLEKAGGTIFDNLPIIFAVGIAFGLTRDKHDNGSAGLAGFIGYSVLVAALNTLNSKIDMNVFAGIISGLTAGIIYNRFYKTKLPDFLGFFGGRRCVSIVTALVSVILALILSVVWPPIQSLIEFVGQTLIEFGSFGTFLYGVLNRLLIPLGLHHILNNLVFFGIGEYTNPVTGEIVRGDMTRFFAGDPTAGIFLTGGFPVMMFGLPAVAFAIYRTAKPENRPKIAGALASMALTSFLTGVTEPIEFSFMFMAPALYILHAILLGMSMLICYNIGVICGCSFSMGFIDYVLNWNLATRPELIIPIGIIFGLFYYIVFSQVIVNFDLPTMGRFEDEISEDNANAEDLAKTIVTGLGGNANLKLVDSCVTRLRVSVKDATKVDEKFLNSLGGVTGVFIRGTAVQLVLGFKAESVANEINDNKKG